MHPSFRLRCVAQAKSKPTLRVPKVELSGTSRRLWPGKNIGYLGLQVSKSRLVGYRFSSGADTSRNEQKDGLFKLAARGFSAALHFNCVHGS
jgi:hypothetical protein